MIISTIHSATTPSVMWIYGHHCSQKYKISKNMERENSRVAVCAISPMLKLVLDWSRCKICVVMLFDFLSPSWSLEQRSIP
ncbi:hypothetical protein IEQ34_004079 [Dendrobium chrysotoxum]|uniref:Uncharacterized protein n=1 Tax=Dendrobium chrysotoxum TaxID=161865 RepID=A0AAV7HD40_DENCH|nr:hypothetical protein IEQ34_004079 [Dendrobium chrysotoxum]